MHDCPPFPPRPCPPRPRAAAIGHAQVVDLAWRLDYHVRSSTTGVVNRPVYLVTLKTMERDGTPRDHEFTCSLEQMQDLAAIVRDANKQVDRILSSAAS